MHTKHTTPIEQYIIDAIRKRREELNMSQAELANEIDVSYGFIGMVESPKYKAKYNVNHINKIAKALKCSPKDFLPEKPLKVK